MTKLEELKENGEAPDFLLEEGFKVLQGGYMLPNETPKTMYKRVAKAAASYYEHPKKWETKFFDAIWKGWLCPASPVLSNMNGSWAAN